MITIPITFSYKYIPMDMTDTIYLTTTINIQINIEELPDWPNYIAIDLDGDVNLFEKPISPREDYWELVNFDGEVVKLFSLDRIITNWKDTKREIKR